MTAGALCIVLHSSEMIFFLFCIKKNLNKFSNASMQLKVIMFQALEQDDGVILRGE